VSTEEHLFPSFGYYLDESDPDKVILRRHDDAFVAAFSAMGATREGIIEVAKADYEELIRDNSLWRGHAAVERRDA
jgi:hypothetical protein